MKRDIVDFCYSLAPQFKVVVREKKFKKELNSFSGFFETPNVILIDKKATNLVKVSAFFHELGHFLYYRKRCSSDYQFTWKDEYAAFQIELLSLSMLSLDEALDHAVVVIANLASGKHKTATPDYMKAANKVMKTKLWAKVTKNKNKFIKEQLRKIHNG